MKNLDYEVGFIFGLIAGVVMTLGILMYGGVVL